MLSARLEMSTLWGRVATWPDAAVSKSAERLGPIRSGVNSIFTNFMTAPTRPVKSSRIPKLQLEERRRKLCSTNYVIRKKGRAKLV
jgi:hypothetical protein